MKPGLTKSDRKYLWAILWRLLVFGPILLPLGFAFFTLIVAAAFLPIGYGIVLIVLGHPIWGCALIVIWLVVLRRARFLFHKLLQGLEYSSL